MDLLVVEDDRALADILKLSLEDLGHQVRTAGTLAAGLSETRRQRPDILLLDVHLPDGSAIDWLSILRTDANPSSVIMMTAVPEVKPAVTAMRMGAEDYLPKPFTLEELQQVVNRIGKERARAPRLPPPSRPETLEDMERRSIVEALARRRGNKSGASRDLGVTRQTLANKIKKYQTQS